MRVLPYVLGHHTSAPGAALLLSGEGRNISRGCRGVGGQISGELRPRYLRQSHAQKIFPGNSTGGSTPHSYTQVADFACKSFWLHVDFDVSLTSKTDDFAPF